MEGIGRELRKGAKEKYTATGRELEMGEKREKQKWGPWVERGKDTNELGEGKGGREGKLEEDGNKMNIHASSFSGSWRWQPTNNLILTKQATTTPSF